MPIPTTIYRTRVASAFISANIPQNFFPSTNRSFGHFKSGSILESICRTASCTASPAASESITLQTGAAADEESPNSESPMTAPNATCACHGLAPPSALPPKTRCPLALQPQPLPSPEYLLIQFCSSGECG